MPAGVVLAQPRRVRQLPAACNPLRGKQRQPGAVLFSADAGRLRHQWPASAQRVRRLPVSRAESLRAAGKRRAFHLGTDRSLPAPRAGQDHRGRRRFRVRRTTQQRRSRSDAARRRVPAGESDVRVGRRQSSHHRLDGSVPARRIKPPVVVPRRTIISRAARAHPEACRRASRTPQTTRHCRVRCTRALPPLRARRGSP